MRALVTGAAGFLGSHLVDELLYKKYKVLGIDNLFRGKLKNLPIDGEFKFVNVDLCTEIKKLKEVIHDFSPDIVFHYAAINGTKYFYDIPDKVFNDNIDMTKNLLECIPSTVKKIIYASSSEVYGDNPKIPTKEDEKITLNIFEKRDSYASSKAFGEFYIKTYCETNNLDYLILRPFNTYGTRMDRSDYGQVIPEFYRKIINDTTFKIIGDGRNTRSFCHVKDHKKLAVLLAEKIKNDIVNIGFDHEIDINQLAEIMHKIFKREFNPTYLPARSYDTKRRKPDISKIKNLIPDYKYTDIEKGINISFLNKEIDNEF